MSKGGGPTVEFKVRFRNGAKGRRRMKTGEAPRPIDPGLVPRVARLLALAHKMEDMVRSGAVRDYAELARLGGVSRARVTQIMNLLLLAPDIQEAILLCASTPTTVSSISEKWIRQMLQHVAWSKQRTTFRRLRDIPIKTVEI